MKTRMERQRKERQKILNGFESKIFPIKATQKKESKY